MAKKLKVGVIGCGKVAQTLHLPEYSVNADVEITALCDIDEGRLKKCAGKYGVTRTYEDYRWMLKESGVEAVSVCTPNYLHHEMTMAALKVGIHVLVEKPMALSSKDAGQMIMLARKVRRVLMVNQTQRFSGVHRKAKEVMESGMMGKVLGVATSFGHPGPEKWSPWGKWFFQKDKAGFGPMADLGIHKADLVLWLTGKKVAEVSAFMALVEKKNTDVEDNFVGTLKFTDGTLGTISTSWTVKGAEINYTYLYCENGTLAVSAIPGRPLVAFMVKPACVIDFQVPAIQSNEQGTWLLGVMDNFVATIRGKEKCLVPGQEGKAALDVILACDKSARTGRTVKL